MNAIQVRHVVIVYIIDEWENIMDDFREKDYEPTKEEWDEIEELIMQEEDEERMEYAEEKVASLEEFKEWCRENGILW